MVDRFRPWLIGRPPALLLQPGDPMAAELGFYGAVAFAILKALVAIGLSGMAVIGFLFMPLMPLDRIICGLAALCLLGDFRFSDSTGFILAVVCLLRQWRQRPRGVAAAA